MFGGSKPSFGVNTTAPGFGFNNTTAASPFGQSSFAKPATSGFGQTPTFGQQNTSLFGGGQQTTGLFGGNQQQPAFGTNIATTQQSGFGGFGQQQQNAPLFGSPQGNTSLFSASGFGANKPAPFGGAQNTSLFGTTNTPQAVTTGIFGSPPPTGGLFGNNQATFGGAAGSTGTAVVKYQPSHGTDTLMKSGNTTNINTKQHCITAMKEYESKSLEELRLEDYAENRKGGGAQVGQAPSLFGPQSTNSGLVFGQQQTGGIFAPQDNKNVFGSQAPTGFNQTATGFGQAGQQTSIFNKTFQGNTATTSTFGGFNNTTATANNPFGQKPFGQTNTLFGQTQPPTSTTSTFGNSSFFGTTQQQPQQGTSFFGNTDNKPFALPGIQQPTQQNAFGSFGATQTQPAQNQQGFGMAKPTNNFSFNTPTSQQNTMGNTGFPGFGQQNTSGGLFNNNNAFGPKLPTSNFGFTSQPNQPLMGGVGGISLGTSGGSSFFNNNANKPGGLFGTTTTQQGGLFGNNTFGNSSTIGGFGTSNLGNNGLGTSSAPTTYPVHQQIMALTSSPYGDSPIFKDLKSSGMSDDALKATNPAAQKAILETKSNQYKVSPKPTTSIKTKPVVGILSKKSLFDGLEEHDSTIEENFNLAVNPRRLIIKKKNRNNLNLSSADSNNDGSPLSTPQSSVPNTPKLPLEGRMSLHSNISLNGNDVRDDYNTDIQKNLIMNPDSESTRRESWLNINGLEKMKQTNRISELSPSLNDNTLLEYKSSDTNINRNSEKLSSSHGNSSEILNPLGMSPGGTRGSPGRFAAQTSSDSLILNTSFVNESISITDVNTNYEPHPTGIILNRSGYYTIPSLDEITTYLKDDGTCIVPNFTVGRKGYGNVYFNEPIDVAGMNLDEIVFFRNKEVTIYPDDDSKPAQGDGLNRKAQITLDQVWPIDKTVHEPIKDPERLIEMDYEGKLRRVCDKHDTKFIEYRSETGSWVFRVNHFSKYGLLSDSDEEDNVPTDAKKAKLLKKNTGTIPKATGTLAVDVQNGNSGLFQADDTGKLFNMDQENINIDFNKNKMSETRTMYMPISPTTDIALDIGADSHKIQLMKASFFVDDNYDRRSTISEYGGGRESPDQIVPTKSLFSTKNFENTVLHSRLSDFMEHEITSKDLTVMSSYKSKEKLNIFDDDDKLREEDSPQINRIVIVKPKISLVKLPDSIVPLQDSIFSKLKGNYLADVGFMHGRQFRVGWGFQNSLIIMNTKHNIETNTKNISHQLFKERDVDDNSSCLLQHIKISSFAKNVDRRFFDSIEKHLEIELNYATFHFENAEKNCPYIQSNGGTLSIEDHFDAADSVAHYDDFSDYKNSVYSLIRVLWGDREELENQEPTNHSTIMCRRNLLSEWLEQNTQSTKINLDPKSSGYLEALWDLIMSHKIADACELAFQNDDLNLSLLLAQISGGPAIRQLIDHQLSSWQYVQADKFIAQERLKIFQLIANVPVLDSSHGVLNVFDNLDWINVIALHIWYLLTPTASLTEALVHYEKAFESEKFYAAPPRPLYAVNNLKTNLNANYYDLRFHLIRLYSRRNYPLESLLNPSTYTSDPMDYRLSWLVLQTLESLGYNHCSELSESQIHLSLANQLESYGLWQWAIFVLLHIKNESRRELCIQNLLYKYISLSDDPDYLEKENFIQNKLKISEKWIFWAKAVKAGSQKAYHEQAKYLLKAKQWSLAHEIIMAHIVPDAIMNDDIKYIKEFLEVFEDSRKISSWLIQGQVILDYIDMVEKFENLKSVPETDLETYWDALKPQLGDLCSRIMLFPCPTSKHRLCQSEIAQKLACLIRGILITKDVNPCLVIKMALEKLPLPQEYAQQELRVLLDTYFTDTNNLMEC